MTLRKPGQYAHIPSLQEVKNTTHEFYETLERITNELRGMTVSLSDGKTHF